MAEASAHPLRGGALASLLSVPTLETLVMHVLVNGKPHEVPATAHLKELLLGLGLKPERVVVERNGQVVGRDGYGETLLADGDVLELLSFVGGG